jgi:hypothetical protein
VGQLSIVITNVTARHYLGTTHYDGCGDAHYDSPKHAGCKRTKIWPGSWEGKRNRIRCLHCTDVIEARHRHDYKSCKCGFVSIDGGFEGHWRRLWKEGDPKLAFEEMP